MYSKISAHQLILSYMGRLQITNACFLNIKEHIDFLKIMTNVQTPFNPKLIGYEVCFCLPSLTARLRYMFTLRLLRSCAVLSNIPWRCWIYFFAAISHSVIIVSNPSSSDVTISSANLRCLTILSSLFTFLLN